jgi:beta-glucosidase
VSAISSESAFLWGTATSSHQIEGNNVHNDWWQWESKGNIQGGVRSGLATDHWNRFREDIRLAAELGLNSYRFSIEWSRVEPEEGRFDSAAFDWYLGLIAECEKHHLLPMLTLHHFTSPIWFAEDGGFTHPLSPQRFGRFVSEVAKRLGAHIPLWCTFNEPIVLVVGTYFGNFMPPAQFAPKQASLACHHLLKAHVLAYDILHQQVTDRKGPWKDSALQVGIAHNMLDFRPDRLWHPIEQVLSKTFHRFYNRSFLDAVSGKKQHFGVWGLMPYAHPVPEALGRRTVDFIGLNYYTKAYIQWKPRDANPEMQLELPLGFAFARRKELASDVGWAIHPLGLMKMMRICSSYRVPIYITENGIADRQDVLRPFYLRAHLYQVAQAIHYGIDVRGYFHWSLLDNFEWIKGYGPRFGLYQVNYETFERTETNSAKLYRKIIAQHQSSHQLKPSLNSLMDIY